MIRKTFFSIWKSLFVICFFFITIACSSITPIQFAQSCETPTELKDHFKGNSELLGCLVFFWQSQSPSSSYEKPVQLQSDGTLKQLDSDPENPTGIPRIKLPKEAAGNEIQARLLFFNSDKSEALSKKLDDHKVLCRKMAVPEYNCFLEKNREECWMMLRFQPQGNDLKVFPLKLKDGKSCQVCQQEKCDGKDNNCNGRIDEFDEENNKPCPVKP